MTATAGAQNARRILRLHAAARQNLDSPVRLFVQLTQDSHPFPGRLFLAAGEDPLKAQVDQSLQGNHRPFEHVERAMKHKRLPRGTLNQRTAACLIHFSVLSDQADNETIRAVYEKEVQVAFHHREVSLRVNEPTGARPKHDEQGEANLATHLKEQTRRRR